MEEVVVQVVEVVELDAVYILALLPLLHPHSGSLHIAMPRVVVQAEVGVAHRGACLWIVV